MMRFIGLISQRPLYSITERVCVNVFKRVLQFESDGLKSPEIETIIEAAAWHAKSAIESQDRAANIELARRSQRYSPQAPSRNSKIQSKLMIDYLKKKSLFLYQARI
jgi:hypothetical protein